MATLVGVGVYLTLLSVSQQSATITLQTLVCLPQTAHVKCEDNKSWGLHSSMCWSLHEDNHKLIIVHNPEKVMESVNKVIRKKAHSTEEMNRKVISDINGEEEQFENCSISPQIIEWFYTTKEIPKDKKLWILEIWTGVNLIQAS